MTDLSDIYQTKWPAAPTYAEPVSDTPLGDIFAANERAQRLTGSIVSDAAAREEAYDRRIETIRQTTGVTLENPERLGYAQETRRRMEQDIQNGDLSPIDYRAGVLPYQRRMFDQKVAELQAKHPDLQFGGMEEEARALATEAQENFARAEAQPGNPALKWMAGTAGSLWAGRRDPMVLGTLFAGPAMAVGRSALQRIATSALIQGLFNFGVAVVSQPAVQDWHEKIGMETGIKPAMQDVGMAFLSGIIPGAAFRGIHEGVAAAAPSITRLLRGQPEPGDIKTATEALAPQPAPPAMAMEDVVAGAQSLPERAMRAGEDSLAADRATLTEKPPGVSAEVHDDLVAAALKRADDPEAPSPEAVAAIQPPETIRGAAYTVAGKTYEAPNHILAMDKAVEDLKVGGYDDLIDLQAGEDFTQKLAAHRAAGDGFVTSTGRVVTRDEAKVIAEGAGQGKASAERGIKSEELQARIEQANPRNPREAMAAADQALDDFGRRDGMAELAERMRAAREAQDETTQTWRSDETRERPGDGDIRGAVPMLDRNDNVVMRSERAVRSDGDIEVTKADLIRSCK